MYCPKCGLKTRKKNQKKCPSCDCSMLDIAEKSSPEDSYEPQNELILANLIKELSKDLEELQEIEDRQAESKTSEKSSGLSPGIEQTEKEEPVAQPFDSTDTLEAESAVSTESLKKELGASDSPGKIQKQPGRKSTRGVKRALIVSVIVLAVAGWFCFVSDHDLITTVLKLDIKQETLQSKSLKTFPEKDDNKPLPKSKPPKKTNHENNIKTVKLANTEKGTLPSAVYTIHTGSYKNRKLAVAETKRLGKLGIAADVTEVKLKNILWYRVMAGKFKTLEEAKKMQSRLKKENRKMYTRIIKKK